MEKGRPRGWEFPLSHDFTTSLTTAFCKGATNSCILDCVKHLKASPEQISHPMLFPVIIISHYHSAKMELRQRDARKRLHKIECALTHHRIAPGFHGSYKDEQGLINFDQIILELTECHTQVLKKRPYAYLRVLDGFDEAMSIFEKENPERGKNFTEQQRDTHLRLSSRIDFYRKKLHGQEYYQSVSLERLEVQRSAVGAIALPNLSHTIF